MSTYDKMGYPKFKNFQEYKNWYNNASKQQLQEIMVKQLFRTTVLKELMEPVKRKTMEELKKECLEDNYIEPSDVCEGDWCRHCTGKNIKPRPVYVHINPVVHTRLEDTFFYVLHNFCDGCWSVLKEFEGGESSNDILQTRFEDYNYFIDKRLEEDLSYLITKPKTEN